MAYVVYSLGLFIMNWFISKIPSKLPSWNQHLIATTSTPPKSLQKAIKDVTINGIELSALIDSGSSHSFVHPRVVDTYALPVVENNDSVSLADKSLTNSCGHCFVDLMVGQRTYSSQKLSIMKNLCVDVILGLDWQARHVSLTFKFDGPEALIELCDPQQEHGVCGLA